MFALWSGLLRRGTQPNMVNLGFLFFADIRVLPESLYFFPGPS